MISNSSIGQLLLVAKHPTNLIEQYYANLSVRYSSVRKTSQEDSTTINRIGDLLLDSDKSWLKAYEIEKLLIFLSDEHSIDTDLKRTFMKYRLHFSEHECKHFQKLIATTDQQDLDKKRTVLLSLLDELHLFYMKRSEYRDYGVLTRVRVSFAFILGVLLFILSLLHFCYIDLLDLPSKTFIIAIISGYLGATFSLLVGLKSALSASNMEDLKIMHRLSYIFKRASIGVGGALILYFLIQANLIEGGLFPNLPVISNPDVADTYKQISLVITWSIIAGFTEMLVPRLLRETEKKVTARGAA